MGLPASSAVSPRRDRRDADGAAPPVAARRVPDTVNADDLALDALLDKISAGGMDALSDEERRQLDEIRERRSSTD